MLYVDIILLLLIAAGLICSVLAAIPKSFRDPPRPVLICCAHSDDCVIMGAEYAYGAIQNGLSVRVAYLTCSGPYPDAEISQLRKMEALTAWSAFGVPRENLTFINLVQSSVSGPSSHSEEDIAYARETFKNMILSLPDNAAMIVPAEGETHVDHKTVRKASLQAAVDSRREDLLVYECPEYNTFLSLVHCPKRTIRTVLRHVPTLHRLVKPYVGSPNFVNGNPGVVFRDTPSRLAKKKELLRYFSSQDGELLLRLFGYETPYRRIAISEFFRKPNSAWWVSAFGCCCDPSALVLGVSLVSAVFLTAYEAARRLTIAFSPALALEKYLPLLGVLVAGIYLVRSLRRTASLETSLFVWAAALGLVFGGFWGKVELVLKQCPATC